VLCSTGAWSLRNVNDFFDGPFQYEVGLAQGRRGGLGHRL